jgi:hypothetical protein
MRVKKKKTRQPSSVPQVLVAVVQPVKRRLSRIEDLLIEMRGVQDRHLKRIATLQKQIDELSATVEEQFSRPSVAS